MSYDEFVLNLEKYWELREQGLKKQANAFSKEFFGRFDEQVSESVRDELLFEFCREYFDEARFLNDRKEPRHIPFELSMRLEQYLRAECEKDKMPHLRWVYEFKSHNADKVLERAYRHEKCDEKTVRLYFGEQLRILDFGQHHFPEACLITKDEFDRIEQLMDTLLKDNIIDPTLTSEFYHYADLYHAFFEWEQDGRKGSFEQLCRSRKVDFEQTAAYYYK